MSDFNLYLYLGSYWVNTSRDTRLDTILDTIPDTKSGPELRSLDQLIELKLRISRNWTQRSLDKVELKTFENEDPKPVPRSLTKEGSVRGRSLQSSSSTGSTRIRISCCSLHTDTPGFFQPIFSSLTSGKEVSLTLISKVRHWMVN